MASEDDDGPPPPPPPDEDDDEPAPDEDRIEGFLDKLSPNPKLAKAGKGWQKRWFVLSGGKLSYYKLEDAQTMFDRMDADKSGYLDATEVMELCKAMGMKKIKPEVITAAMAQMDTDGNNEVCCREVPCSATARLCRPLTVWVHIVAVAVPGR